MDFLTPTTLNDLGSSVRVAQCCRHSPLPSPVKTDDKSLLRSDVGVEYVVLFI
jgi:hypothetical protein